MNGVYALPLVALVVVALSILIPNEDIAPNPGKSPPFWINAVTGKQITVSSLQAEREFRIGEIFRLQKKYSDAKMFYQQAISLAPDFVEALDRLGFCFLMAKDYPAAESHFKRAISFNPTFFRTRFYLGRLYAATNRPKEALVELQVALELEKLTPWVGIEYCQLLHRMRMFSDEGKVLDELKERFPKNRTVAKLVERRKRTEKKTGGSP